MIRGVSNKKLLEHLNKIRDDIGKDEQYFCGNCLRIINKIEELVSGKPPKKRPTTKKEAPKCCSDCDGPLVLSRAGCWVCDVGCQK